MENLWSGCSPAVESAFLCAQPKIHALLTLVEFAADNRAGCTTERPRLLDETVRVCGLVRGLRNKATVAHAFHYYSLKLGEVWNENGLLSLDPRHGPPTSPVESQSIDIMTVRHAYLMALVKMIMAHRSLDGRGGSAVSTAFDDLCTLFTGSSVPVKLYPRTTLPTGIIYNY